ncbi:hypothetical protein [Actinosynnema sp. NPDC023587]|uniref:hypothetical protein n=1 Tax=Actinosynnema sp. NPDC023587 TaxID=3154695 RepID=UPI0033D7989D
MTERLTTDDFVPPEKRDNHPDNTYPDPNYTDPAHADAAHGDPAHATDVPHDAARAEDTDVVASDHDVAHDGSADFGRGTADKTGFDRDPEVEVVPVGGTDQAADQSGQVPGSGSGREDDEPLFGDAEADDLQTRWRGLQADFVDDPQDAVHRADELVAQVIGSLANTFAEHRRSLEEQWKQEGHADTEELRVALRRYRTFFDRLLSV